MTTIVKEFQVLLCRRTVPRKMYMDIQQHVIDQAKHLKPCWAYTLKQICVKQFYARFGRGKTIAGLIMADLVKSGVVPYELASEPGSKPYFYRLKKTCNHGCEEGCNDR